MAFLWAITAVLKCPNLRVAPLNPAVWARGSVNMQ